MLVKLKVFLCNIYKFLLYFILILILKIGAGHFDEVLYLFNSTMIEKLNLNPIETDSAHKLSEQMTEMWTDFDKFG